MIGPDDSADRSSGRPGPRRVAVEPLDGRSGDAAAAAPTGRAGGAGGRGDDPIRAALRSLPAETAGPGFTDRVLARLDEGERTRRPAILRPAAGWTALAAAALAGAVGIAVVRSGGPPAEQPERVAEVRSEKAAGDGERRATAVPVAGGTAGAASPAPPELGERTAVGAERRGDDPARGSMPGSAGAEPPSTSRRPASSPEPATARARGGRPSDSGRGSAAGSRIHGEPRPSAPPPAGDPRLAAVSSSAPAAGARDSLARLRAELDALRREHRRLEIGLSDLPEVGRDGQPVIYLGGDEGLGLVLDLGSESVRGGGARHDQDSGTSL